MRYLLFIACSLFAATVTASNGVYVVGVADCGKWDSARKANTAVALENYVIGALDGFSIASDVEFWRVSGATAPSAESIYLWMDKYCRDHPLQSMVGGAMALFHERTGKQLLPATPSKR